MSRQPEGDPNDAALWRPVLDGMDLLVLPDDDEQVAWLAPGDVACDGRRLFVKASDWPRLHDLLLSLAEPGDPAGPRSTGPKTDWEG